MVDARRAFLLILHASLALGVVTGCASGDSGTDPDGGVMRLDSGREDDDRRDSGREDDEREGTCGRVGQDCCEGSANDRCQGNLVCCGGTCSASTSRGREDQPCCPGDTCQGDLVCDGNRCVEATCGRIDQECCAGGRCSEGICATGMEKCKDPEGGGCGNAGQDCCPEVGGREQCDASASLVCQDGTCVDPAACGESGQPCCDPAIAPDPCGSGLVCNSDEMCETQPACGGPDQPCCPTGEACPSSSLRCCGTPGVCRNIVSNAAFCGGCGQDECESGQCRNSECVPPPECGQRIGDPCCDSPPRSCMAPGLTCSSDDTCQRESTEPMCTALGSECSEASACCSAGDGVTVACRPRRGRTENVCCVEQGQACGTSAPCCGQMQCVDGTCRPQIGSTVCDDTRDCATGLTCEPDEDGEMICQSADADVECMAGIDPAAADACESCITIGQRFNCGWCIDGDGNGTCVPGNTDGAFNRECAIWRKSLIPGLACDENDACAGATTCLDCAEREECGWCSGTCKRANAAGDGPADESNCTWQDTDEECNADPCNAYGTCGECLDREGCSFCDSSDSCHMTSRKDEIVCPNDEWDDAGPFHPLINSCDENVDRCAQHVTCGACAEASGCGWCAAIGTGGTCMQGTAGGDDSNVCPGDFWQFGAESCGTDPCNQFDDSCSTCVAQEACGWCPAVGGDPDDHRCVLGRTSPGVPGLVCPEWQSTESECRPFCGGFTECGECVAEDNCGWCDSRDTCERGDSNNSWSGSCASDWDWNSGIFNGCDNTESCSSLSTDGCEACLAEDHCGFCYGNEECIPLNGRGLVERAGECPGLAVAREDVAMCEGGDPCSGATGCNSCLFSLDGRSCGFCASSGLCQSGSSGGPQDGSCADWVWFSCL